MLGQQKWAYGGYHLAPVQMDASVWGDISRPRRAAAASFGELG